MESPAVSKTTIFSILLEKFDFLLTNLLSELFHPICPFFHLCNQKPQAIIAMAA